jgi:hypothetical protein
VPQQRVVVFIDLARSITKAVYGACLSTKRPEQAFLVSRWLLSTFPLSVSSLLVCLGCLAGAIRSQNSNSLIAVLLHYKTSDTYHTLVAVTTQPQLSGYLEHARSSHFPRCNHAPILPQYPLPFPSARRFHAYPFLPPAHYGRYMLRWQSVSPWHLDYDQDYNFWQDVVALLAVY